VSVLTQSGNAGTVVSTAKWDADGCSLIFATFTITCTATGSTQPVQPSGSQMALQPVVSAAEQGKIVGARNSSVTILPALKPVSSAQSSPQAGTASAGSTPDSAITGGGVYRTSGHDKRFVGGARTQLASENSIPSAVSPTATGSLTSWWVLLTLCVVAAFLVALTYVACRHGSQRS
jgi:hypothetical protein